MAEKISLPDAFSFCSEEAKKCECKHTDKPGDKTRETITCEDSKTPKDKCAKDGCYCELFRHATGDKHKNDKWQVAPPAQSKTGAGPFETEKNDKWTYECYCVKPVLPTGYTLCGCDTCDLSLGKGVSLDQANCEGKCAGEGNCHMFRIKHPDKDSDGKEAWEHVTGPGRLAKYEKGYYYRCFCVTVK
jgi:hypothetical protein